MCPFPGSDGQSGGVNISGPIGSVGGDIVGGNKGLDEAGVRLVVREELSAIATAKGVPEAPLLTVLDKLGEKRVRPDEIPARLAAAANELLELRAEFARLKNDHPNAAAISNEAVGLIDKGDLDSAASYWTRNRDAILKNMQGATPEMIKSFEAMNQGFIQLLEFLRPVAIGPHQRKSVAAVPVSRIKKEFRVPNASATCHWGWHGLRRTASRFRISPGLRDRAQGR